MTDDKKLRRTRDDKMIAGVCGGLADFFGLDSTLVRVVYTLLTFFTAFAGCLVYLILWFIMPWDLRKLPTM